MFLKGKQERKIMKAWEKISSTPVVHNKWVKLRKDTVKLPNGVILDDYYLFEKNDVALVVAIDEQNCIILKKEYRYPVNEVLYELPGGMIEEGEDPLETAKRELLEETGNISDDWKQILCGYDYPSKDTNSVYIFLAKNVKKAANQKLDISEDLEMEKVPLQGAVKMCQNNQIKVNGSISGILLTELALKE